MAVRVARASARGLCKDRTADAERGYDHGCDDQFLYHRVNSLENQSVSGVSPVLYHRSKVRAKESGRTHAPPPLVGAPRFGGTIQL